MNRVIQMVPQIPIQKLSRSRLVLEVCNTPTCECTLVVCVFIGTQVNEQSDSDGPTNSHTKTVKKSTGLRGM